MQSGGSTSLQVSFLEIDLEILLQRSEESNPLAGKERLLVRFENWTIHAELRKHGVTELRACNFRPDETDPGQYLCCVVGKKMRGDGTVVDCQIRSENGEEEFKWNDEVKHLPKDE